MTRGHTVLQVPVPALEPFVLGRYHHYDPTLVSADPHFVHAHVTALGPFLDPLHIGHSARVTIGRIAFETQPFAFRLARLDTFPNGIIHLLPEPDDAFRGLTRRLWQAFPNCPPYAGQFPSARPHLTLDARSQTVSEESTRRLLGGLVPVDCRAERLELVWYESGGSRVLMSWRLGLDDLTDQQR
ncbi:2'-5' RNA ligase family protein [Intrasporangium sp. DVR]|uniref:2'-5' RNA ligase family protein n=1 Tax=Intrasporangium sp. DVR TaxID=3127867 RepID=UPI00313A536E